PGARRLRLHGGVSGGPLLPGREDLGDRRGHQRDPADADRTRPRPAGRVGSVPMTDHFKDVAAAREATLRPTPPGAAKLESQGKLYVRDRLALLFDEGTFVEDGQLANAQAA